MAWAFQLSTRLSDELVVEVARSRKLYRQVFRRGHAARSIGVCWRYSKSTWDLDQIQA